jgi:hypothetical protein
MVAQRRRNALAAVPHSRLQANMLLWTLDMLGYSRHVMGEFPWISMNNFSKVDPNINRNSITSQVFGTWLAYLTYI